MQRRTVVIAGATMLITGTFPPRQWAHADFSESFAEVERSLGGRIGVAAIDTANNARRTHRSGERFAMCSTFKWLLAAAVLAKIEQARGTLDQRLKFSATDILANSPVTRLHVAEGGLSIRELCKAAVEVSDNTAANTLLHYIGGPEAVTAYARSLGDPITRLDRVEPDLNSHLQEDPRDTTTPEAMIITMQKVLLDDALAPASRATLIEWLKSCQTGLHRLRAGLPATWAVGDKTGTGDNGAANDIAIIWPPLRAPILVASYCDSDKASPDSLNAAHARIGHIVAAAFA